MNILKDKRVLAIIAVVIVFGVVSLVGLLSMQSKKDLGSTAPNPAAEEADKAIDTETQFLSISALNERGLKTKQADGLEQAFNKFKPDAKRVIVFANTVQSGPPDDTGIKTYTFTVDVDGTTYQAKLNAAELTIIRLYLFDDAGKQVFDSQFIDTLNQ